ncbi:30S ribosomal protein S8 [bacterium]|nr:30S ribosomal protein S8 [bacterium]
MDTIGDMLIRIKNAYAVGKETVEVPYSKFKLNLAKILEKEGYIGEIMTQGRKARKVIRIKLKYRNKIPAVKGCKRISKPGRRIYVKKDEIPKPKYNGRVIISTPYGLVTDIEARKKKLGGEVICQIW